MDPTQVASLTGLLTAIGLGKYAAGIMSLVTLALALAPQIMPFLPVPETSSAAWYRIGYAVLAKVTGNRGPNTPVPASTLAVAKAAQLGLISSVGEPFPGTATTGYVSPVVSIAKPANPAA